MNSPKKFNNNPLVSLMRQPKIYIRLPSNGEFWPNGSLVASENEEYPVYSMTAQDELKLKVPDALMNGQAMVDVIQNCMPNIKNAWMIPNIDLDVILIAIRIATYGEQMKVPIGIDDFDYSIDLRYVLSELAATIQWESRFEVNSDLVVHVRPINYKQVSDTVTQGFETQRILELANNKEISEEVKLKSFKEKFEKLNALTTGLIHSSVFKIESSQGTTDNPVFIREFLENADKEIFDAIKKHVETMKERNTLKPLKINPTPAMLDAGVPDKVIEVPLIFDASIFFA